MTGVEHAVLTGALLLAALVADVVVLFLDVVCIGSCTETPVPGALSYIAGLATVVGLGLRFTSRRGAGTVVLALPIVVAIVSVAINGLGRAESERSLRRRGALSSRSPARSSRAPAPRAEAPRRSTAVARCD